MYKTTLVARGTFFDVLVSGRKIIEITRNGEPVPIGTLMGETGALAYDQGESSMKDSRRVVLYSTLHENHLRYVYVSDIGGVRHPYYQTILDILKEPIENLKTVLEFLSL